MGVERHGPEARSPRKKRKYLIREVAAPSVVETPAPRHPSTAEPDPAAAARFTKSRHERIAELAYYKAERRGFVGGDPDRDWREAELEVEEQLRKGRPF